MTKLYYARFLISAFDIEKIGKVQILFVSTGQQRKFEHLDAVGQRSILLIKGLLMFICVPVN
jgi:hypothetical protein